MIEKLIEIVKIKNSIDKKQQWYTGSEIYLEGLRDEVEEVQEEMKENNVIHLEDELGDILWDYLNLLEGLSKEGKIDSLESVLLRAEKKYTQRVDAINIPDDSKRCSAWDAIKSIQKKELKEEHIKRYGK